MKQIVAKAKKLDDAIAEGLAQLGVERDDVEVEIISLGGFFRKAEVRLTLLEDDRAEKKPESDESARVEFVRPSKNVEKSKSDGKKSANKSAETKVRKEASAICEKKEVSSKAACDERRDEYEKKPATVDTRPEVKKAVPKKVDAAQTELAKEYMTELLKFMKIDASVEISTEHGSIDIDIVTEDSSVIGHRGEVLDAMQILCKRAVEEGNDKFVHVNVDSHNYRATREETLVKLAKRMAVKCVRTGRKVTLEPMSNTHRKVIHSALTDFEGVTTASVGHEPNRRVVIIPQRREHKEER